MHPSQLTLEHLDDVNKDCHLLSCQHFSRNVSRLHLHKQPPYTTNDLIQRICDWLLTALKTDMWLKNRMLNILQESWCDITPLMFLDVDFLLFMNIFQNPSAFVDAMVKIREFMDPPHLRGPGWPYASFIIQIVSICKSQGYFMSNVIDKTRIDKKFVHEIESEHGRFEVSAVRVHQLVGLIRTDYNQFYNNQGVHLSELDHAVIVNCDKDVILFEKNQRCIAYDRKTGEIDLNTKHNRLTINKKKQVRQTSQFTVTRLYPIMCVRVRDKPTCTDSAKLYSFRIDEKESVQQIKGCSLLRSNRDDGIFLYYDGSPVYDPQNPTTFLKDQLHHACGDWVIIKKSDHTYFLVNTELKSVDIHYRIRLSNAMRVNKNGDVFFREHELNKWEGSMQEIYVLTQYPFKESDVTFSERFAFCVTTNTPHTVFVHSLQAKYQGVPLLIRKLSCLHHIYINPSDGFSSDASSGTNKKNIFTYDEDTLLLNCVFYDVNSCIKEQIAIFGVRNYISHDVLKMVSQYLLFL